MNNEIKVYTTEEVAEILQVTKRTVYNYIKAGTPKAVKIGKYWRITAKNLEQFISTGSPAGDINS